MKLFLIGLGVLIAGFSISEAQQEEKARLERALPPPLTAAEARAVIRRFEARSKKMEAAQDLVDELGLGIDLNDVGANQ